MYRASTTENLSTGAEDKRNGHARTCTSTVVVNKNFEASSNLIQ